MGDRLATTDMDRKEEAGSPSNTMWPGPRTTSVSSGILIHPAVWPQQTWAENWGSVVPHPLLGRGAGSLSNTTWPEPRPISAPSDILIHPAMWAQYMGRKVGAAVPIFLGRSWSQCNTISPGPRPTSVYQVASWYIQPFCHNRHLPTIGGGTAPFFGGWNWVPIWHSVAGAEAEAYVLAKLDLHLSNRLATIHQCYRQTDRRDRTGQTTVNTYI